MSTSIESVIMCLDQSSGMLRINEKNNLIGIDLYPATVKSLKSFKNFEVKTILLLTKLISNSVENIKEFIHPFDEVIICENEKNIQKYIGQYSRKTGSTILISSDRVLRGVAANMGILPASHPEIALHILQKNTFFMVQVFGLKEEISVINNTIPYFFYEVENDKWCLLAVMSDGTFQEMITKGMDVQKLSIDLSTEDPIFLEMDEWNEEVLESLKNHKVLSIEGRKIIVALGPTEFNEEVHIHGPKAHVHPQLLLPSPELYYPVENFITFNNDSNNSDSKKYKERVDTRAEILTFEEISASTAQSFQNIVDRYSGKLDLDIQGLIKSRHISHTDNNRVINALQNDLKSLGIFPTLHQFNFSGMSLNNVIADIPGTGSSSFKENVQEELKEVFLKYPSPTPVENWLPMVKGIVGEKWFESQFTMDIPPLTLRKSIEEYFGLKSWFPWWLESSPLQGQGAQLIIVGCHLDSTATSDSMYNPISDPAPGADDDASGIAATLSIAKRLLEFQGRLTHTVRFCFFNAEESGLVGSKTYAAMLKATGAPVKAVICMDMIGFNGSNNHLFEIHAGYNDSAIRDSSLPIAQLIAKHTAGVDALSSQIYQGTSTVSNPDRTLFDGAINRSDHASFHQQGYPAVVISEDFFINLPSEPTSDPNPNYHRRTDKSIDALYGSAITNVIANAVLELAME
ncbi:M28 family metallopeptidase [Bacillus toyonensis]|uniref:M28 family metallopeptidase n=1 Tax=Bacillus toyonensis TaxID=155322 RepID=UPI001443F31A|nr:M20/M25/M40 family metallo-hydrolase [Bacillus toyonensis]NKW96678.1 Zn-dependent exopeptidase M28 [Bacillus toyonensis]